MHQTAEKLNAKVRTLAKDHLGHADGTAADLLEELGRRLESFRRRENALADGIEHLQEVLDDRFESGGKNGSNNPQSSEQPR